MKRRMKAALAFLMTLVLLTGCSGGASSANSESTASEAPQSSSTAQAEATGWKPEKDVTFIVGFDAGGTADIPARVVAKYMSDYSGVNVTVANIVGASGQVAARQVMEAEPDGYTLLHVPAVSYTHLGEDCAIAVKSIISCSLSQCSFSTNFLRINGMMT